MIVSGAKWNKYVYEGSEFWTEMIYTRAGLAGKVDLVYSLVESLLKSEIVTVCGIS